MLQWIPGRFDFSQNEYEMRLYRIAQSIFLSICKYLKVFENFKYFREVFKYKYFHFIKANAITNTF